MLKVNGPLVKKAIFGLIRVWPFCQIEFSLPFKTRSGFVSFKTGFSPFTGNSVWAVSVETDLGSVKTSIWAAASRIDS